MNIVDVVEFLKSQDDMDMLNEFCHEFNYIMQEKRKAISLNKRTKINCGDIVKVQMGAPQGYVEMYVKKLNPKPSTSCIVVLEDFSGGQDAIIDVC